METGVGITTLDSRLLVQTDYGLVPLYNVLKGMMVKTKDGMRYVQSRIVRNKSFFNYFIDIENQRIRFSKDQMFYQKDKPVEGYLLKKGDLIDIIGGQRIITKSSYTLGKFCYTTLVVDSPRSNFCLYNNIIVCS